MPVLHITFLLSFLLEIYSVSGLNRTHYVAILEEEWDYAPDGNLLSKDHSVSDIFTKTQTNPPQIGTKYRKALLREFTDETYTTEVPRPSYMGIIGPFFRGEVGDIIKVNLWNKATYNYSLHPHGTFYDKDDEGAQYLDGTTGEDLLDNAIPPGGKYEYEWTIKPEYGPMENDPSCLSYLYHSHVDAEVEINSGVIGILLVCKQGTLDESGKRNDVDRDFPILFMVFDENSSHYLGWNMQHYIPNATSSDVVANYKNFQLSSQKNSINGRIYGNLKGLEACVGDKISLSLGVAGNDADLHTTYLQGQTMEVFHQRALTQPMYPGETRTVIVHVENPGIWLLSSQSALDMEYGMQTLFTAKICEGKEIPPPLKIVKGKTRKYYIAAEEVWWNYTPTGRDGLSGKKLQDVPNAKDSYQPDPGTADGCPLEGVYKKAIYRAYTNSDFDTPTAHPQYLGCMGPPITAEVGDTIIIIFKNKASRPYSLTAYGFFTQEAEEGNVYKGSSKAVEPGHTQVYRLIASESVRPLDSDPECISGRYYSDVDPVHDTYAGLTGPVLICKNGVLDITSTNKMASEEFFLSFGWMDETLSPYINESVQRKCPEMDLNSLYSSNIFKTQNKIGAINCFAWGNIESPTICKDERTNWHITATGTALTDVHGAYFHGNTFIHRGLRKDTVTVVPDAFETLLMIPDNAGVWAIDDQTDDCYENGMRLKYIVENCPSSESVSQSDNDSFDRKIRTYYIAAVEGVWDYAPYSEIHPITGELLTENAISKLVYVRDDYHMGQTYIKAMYREYTDDTFTEEKKRKFGEHHLGLLGPMIKAEVGDRLRVVFKNNGRFNYSIMAHGVMYDKENEGNNYADSESRRMKEGGSVAPGKMFTYEWNVPERAGPSKDDFNCINWMYLSGVNPNNDVYSGLTGALIICRKGILNDEGRRNDVQREFALFFEFYVEGFSNYFKANVETLKGQKEVFATLTNDYDWFNTNVMMSINGYGYANIPDVTMCLGETAAFYLMGYGNEFQTHTIHFHGNTFTRRLSSGSHRHDVMDVLPGEFETIELSAVNAGKWLVHCHVNNHSENGMLMEYEVVECAKKPYAIPLD